MAPALYFLEAMVLEFPPLLVRLYTLSIEDAQGYLRLYGSNYQLLWTVYP